MTAWGLLRSVELKVGLLALPIWACSYVADVTEYQEISLEVELGRISEGCGECLQRTCGSAFEECAKQESCVAYTACRADDRSPVSLSSCAPDAAHASGDGPFQPNFEKLFQCEDCFEACQVGRDWQCVDRYAWPTVDNGIVHWRHRLVDNFETAGRAPLSGVTVRACRRSGTACGPGLEAEPDLLDKTTTDADGWFEFELEVEAGSTGFMGYFVVSGEQLPTYRLHYTAPLQDARNFTELLTYESIELSWYELPFEGTASMVFQAFDCGYLRAAGVSVVSKAASPLVALYQQDEAGQLQTEGTTVEGDGIGGAIGVGVEPGAFVVQFQAAGQTVGQTPITVANEQVTVVQVVPEGLTSR